MPALESFARSGPATRLRAPLPTFFRPLPDRFDSIRVPLRSCQHQRPMIESPGASAPLRGPTVASRIEPLDAFDKFPPRPRACRPFSLNDSMSPVWPSRFSYQVIVIRCICAQRALAFARAALTLRCRDLAKLDAAWAGSRHTEFAALRIAGPAATGFDGDPQTISVTTKHRRLHRRHRGARFTIL